MKKYLPYILFFLLAAWVAAGPVMRRDMTRDKRYTLSTATTGILDSVRQPMEIEVYLQGEFPSYFRKLAEETRTLLDQFSARNPHIHYKFINPQKNALGERLEKEGMKPAEITVRKNNALRQLRIYPWARLIYGNKKVNVPLLVSLPGKPVEEQIDRSIENLEYAFSSAVYNLTQTHKPSIAVLKGHGEWDDLHLAGLLTALHDNYRLAPFTLDSLRTGPARTLAQLQRYDMVLLAGPTKAFSDTAKYALDQYILNGGKMLMAVDPVHAYKDTLMKAGKTYALHAGLNLTDWLFFYGVRLNPVLVKDLVAAPVVLKTGEVAGNPQLEPFPWYYSPLAFPNRRHPTGKNVGKVKLDFASDIDTIKAIPLKKTVILHSSPYTQTVGVPLQINFSEIGSEPDKRLYHDGIKIFGVLVEGNFRSAYADRVKPFAVTRHRDTGRSKIAVIADGDIVRNDVAGGRPLPLGYDKWSRMQYDNETFIKNVIAYLLDKAGLLKLKNKEFHIPLLDKNKVIAEGKTWAALNTLGPVLFWLLVGLAVYYRRKQKFARRV